MKQLSVLLTSLGPNLRKEIMAVPIYVTRPTGKEGMTGYVSIPESVTNTMLLIFCLNFIGWGVYGLVQLVDKVV